LGDFRLESRSGEALIPMGSWANADDKLGVYLPGDALKLYRPAKRETTINIMHADRNTGADLAHLYCDILVGPFSREYRDLRGGSVDIGNIFSGYKQAFQLETAGIAFDEQRRFCGRAMGLFQCAEAY
jgi:hypothetical protein